MLGIRYQQIFTLWVTVDALDMVALQRLLQKDIGAIIVDEIAVLIILHDAFARGADKKMVIGEKRDSEETRAHEVVDPFPRMCFALIE